MLDEEENRLGQLALFARLAGFAIDRHQVVTSAVIPGGPVTCPWRASSVHGMAGGGSSEELTLRGQVTYPKRTSLGRGTAGGGSSRNSPGGPSRAKVKALTERAPARRERSRAFGNMMIESR